MVSIASRVRQQVGGGRQPQEHDAQLARAAAGVRAAVAMCTALAHSDKVPLGPDGNPVPGDLHRIRGVALSAFSSLKAHLQGCPSPFVKVRILTLP